MPILAKSGFLAEPLNTVFLYNYWSLLSVFYADVISKLMILS